MNGYCIGLSSSESGSRLTVGIIVAKYCHDHRILLINCIMDRTVSPFPVVVGNSLYSLLIYVKTVSHEGL